MNALPRFMILLIGWQVVAVSHANAATEPDLRTIPPSPYQILEIPLAAPPLDAVAPCLGNMPVLDDSRDALEKEGPGAALSKLSEAIDPNDPLTSNELRVAAALLEARVNTQRIDETGLRSSLGKRLSEQGSNSTSEAAEDPVSPKTIACGWLEVARLELRTGHVPEARVSALRAVRRFKDGKVPRAIQRGASFYRAESFAATGDREAALDAHRKLASGDDAIARASRIRIADAEQSLSPTRRGRLVVEKSLDAFPEASKTQWATRIAEWAIADGDREAAMRWLERAADSAEPQTEDLAAAIAIRQADLHYALDTRTSKEEGRRILHDLSENAASRSVQRLAAIREVDLGRRSGEGTLRRLDGAFKKGNRRVAAYAGAILARHLLEAEHYEAALQTLVDLVHQKADTHEGLIDRDLFDQTLSALSTTGSCDDWIAQVSGRRDLLMRHATAPGPFLLLGDCYQQNGMANSALETYRGIAKSFGPTAVGSVTLRSAQTEFQLGRLLSARTVAEANVKRGVEPREGWRILLARIQRADGLDAKAVQTLRPVMKRIAKTANRDLEPVDRDTVLLNAQAAANAGANSTDRALLLQTLEHAMAQADESGKLAEVFLIAADLHRQAGALSIARKLYAPAFNRLEAGPLHSRAAYWQGVLALDPDEARALWGRVAEDPDPWARLAANEIALATGRAEIGAGLSVPSTRLHPPGSQSTEEKAQ